MNVIDEVKPALAVGKRLKQSLLGRGISVMNIGARLDSKKIPIVLVYLKLKEDIKRIPGSTEGYAVRVSLSKKDSK